MEQKKQIQLQFRLKDVRLLQFVNLSNGWPEGDMQIGNQIQFNADTAHIAGISSLGLKAVSLFYGTEESQEGVRAFQEKRKPNFRG